MTASLSDRHLSWHNLAEYLDAGAPAIVSHRPARPMSPWLSSRASTELPCGALGPRPVTFLILPSTGISIPEQARVQRVIGWSSPSLGSGVLREAYPMLLAVADYVQLHGDGMGTAIGRVLSTYREMLSSLGRLSDDQELGLFGELLVLDHLIGSIGAHKAVDSWQGPTREEHDFGLDDFDIEVKTTLTEDRDSPHLQPDPTGAVARSKPLAGIGAVDDPRRRRHHAARKSIDRTMNRLPEPALRARFADRLTELGWDPSQGHLYVRRFIPRERSTYVQGDPGVSLPSRHGDSAPPGSRSSVSAGCRTSCTPPGYCPIRLLTSCEESERP